MNNLYRDPLKYDIDYIEIEKTDIGVRVWDRREEWLPKLIIDLPGDWTGKQVQKLIHVAQQTAKYSFESGRQSKESQIKQVLGIRER